MVNKRAYRSITDRKYISWATQLKATLTLILIIGMMGVCSAQTKKTATVQTKTAAVKQDNNTPMPDNAAMVIPADKQTTPANNTEAPEGSYMDRAISNYVYQQKAKKIAVADTANKKTAADAVKYVSPAEKEKP